MPTTSVLYPENLKIEHIYDFDWKCDVHLDNPIKITQYCSFMLEYKRTHHKRAKRRELAVLRNYGCELEPVAIFKEILGREANEFNLALDTVTGKIFMITYDVDEHILYVNTLDDVLDVKTSDDVSGPKFPQKIGYRVPLMWLDKHVDNLLESKRPYRMEIDRRSLAGYISHWESLSDIQRQGVLVILDGNYYQRDLPKKVFLPELQIDPTGGWTEMTDRGWHEF